MSLYRKYRPQKFADLIGQNHIRDTILQAIREGKISHAYLFSGPRGTGKTSTARLIAKTINCANIKNGEPCNSCQSCEEISAGQAIDIIEIDAASNRGIEEIRELRENVRFAPSSSKKKVYIIDEVHMLTREAFNALLKTLEEPPPHVLFILATTEPHKIPPTITSRTQRFDFKRVKKDDLIENLTRVAKSENIKISGDALDLIAILAEGGHRDAISLLEQVASGDKEVDKDTVSEVVGISSEVETFEILRAIFDNNSEEGLKIAQNLYKQGKSISQLNKSLVELLRKVLIHMVAGKDSYEDTEENQERIKSLVGALQKRSRSVDYVISTLEKFIEAGKLLKDISYPLLPMEMAIVEVCDYTDNADKAMENMHDNPQDLNGNTKQDLSKEHLANTNAEETKTKTNSSGNDSKETKKNIAPKKPQKKSRKAETEGGEPHKKNKQKNSKNKTGNDPKKEKEGQKMDEKPQSQEAPNRKTNSDKKSVDVIDVDVARRRWDDIIFSTKKENHTLAALLRDAKPILVDGNCITLGVKFKFHKDKISEQKNLQILEEVVEDKFGEKCRIVCEIADIRNIKKQKPASDDELQQAAEELFSE